MIHYRTYPPSRPEYKTQVPVAPPTYMGAQDAAGPSAPPAPPAPRDSESDPDKNMTDMAVKELYRKEARDVLWTIVSLKLDEMHVATSQIRAAWRSYNRNKKINDNTLQNKDRAVRNLKVTCLFCFTLHY